MQRHFGGVEHGAHVANVADALLHRFQFAANFGQGAAVGFVPDNFRLAGFGQLGVHRWDQRLGDLPDEGENRRLA